MVKSQITALQTGQQSWPWSKRASRHDAHMARWRHGKMRMLQSFCRQILHNKLTLRLSSNCMAISRTLIFSSLSLTDFSRMLTEDACLHKMDSHSKMHLILCLYSSSFAVLTESFWKFITIASKSSNGPLVGITVS